jgi:hypothetical protein
LRKNLLYIDSNIFVYPIIYERWLFLKREGPDSFFYRLPVGSLKPTLQPSPETN